MAVTLNASTTGGLVQSADNSGIIQLQGNGTTIGTFTSAGVASPITATNPLLALTGSANNYIQAYLFNATNGASASADFTAYPNNGTDSSGWIDMGITSQTFSQAIYSVTGANEGYLFMSAPAGSSTSGNLVIATDSTGTTNSIQFYTNGFNSAKSTAALTIDSSDMLTGLGNSTIPAEHYIVLSSTNTLTSQTAAQPLFDGGGGPTGGQVTLGAGTYQFECMYSLSSMSATSGSFGFAIGGTATNTQSWTAIASKYASAPGGTVGYGQFTTANTAISGTANTNTLGTAFIKGIIRITVSGTIIPQVSLGVAAAAVVGANSYFKISPISALATAVNSSFWS